MQTYSHLLLTAFAGERFGASRGLLRLPLWVGAVAPDVPLYLLTFVYAGRRWLEGRTPALRFGPEYDALFFGDPTWIVPHNFLHAPLILAALLLLGRWATDAGQRWGPGLVWFTLGAVLHSLTDVFTHHDDGPLLLFPLEWSVRFSSPISYWDSAHYAAVVSPVEHALDLLFVAYLVACWRRFRAGATAPDVGVPAS